MPYSCSRSSRSSLDAVANTVAPAAFASWIAARPTPPAPAWTSTVSPGREVAELEQAVVGGAELDRDAGRLLERQPVRDRPTPTAAGTLTSSACEPCAHRRDDRLADVEAARPPRPRARTVPAAWYPTMCGARGEDPALAVEQIAALDADRGDVDQQPAGRSAGSGTSS